MRRIIVCSISIITFVITGFSQIDLVDDKIGIGVLNPAYDIHFKGNDYRFQNESGTNVMQILSSGNMRFNIGRGDVYLESNTYDNLDGSGLTFRTSSNPLNGAILAVRSSGQAARFWVGQNLTSSGYNDFYVGSSSATVGNDPALYSAKIARSGNSYINGGNLGIGTASPLHTLDLGSTLGHKLAVHQNSAGNDFYGMGISSGTLEFHANSANGTSAPKMVLNSVGNVGIGATAPLHKLHLKDTKSIVLSLEADSDNVTETDQPKIQFSQDGGGVLGHIGYTGGTNHLRIANEYANSDADIDFQTAGLTRMTIDGSGKVGIGTIAPSHTLDLGNSFGQKLALYQYPGIYDFYGFGVSSGTLEFHAGSLSNTAPPKMVLKAWGNVGIGTENPSELLHVNGSITYSGSIYRASDKRLKTDISEFEYGLKEVLELNPINFRYNDKISDKKDNRVGVIAQELQKTAPKLVSTFNLEEENEKDGTKEEKEYLKIDDSAIKYMLINAIKDQQVQIDAQEDLIRKQGDMLEELRELIGSGGIEQLENPLLNTIEIALEDSKKEETPYLAQNIPNPTRDATIVKYFIPESAQSATVRFYSLSGQILDEVEIDEMGQGEIKVDLDKMSSGNYMYALIVDDQLIDTKTMAIAK